MPISAATGAGIDALESKLEEVLRGQKALVEYTFPYKDAAKIQLIRKYGELLREEYLEDGIHLNEKGRSLYAKTIASCLLYGTAGQISGNNIASFN